MGSAENLNSTLPQDELHLALCDNSLRPTLTVGRQDYWTEITPILRKWQCVNDAACPYCNRLIRVNMSRHLQASHTENQCYWRCPVTTCPMWFTSELNGKDHLERIHKFREGQGYSFYENSAWSGSASVRSSNNVGRRDRPSGWTSPLLAGLARSCIIIMLSPIVRSWPTSVASFVLQSGI